MTKGWMSHMEEENNNYATLDAQKVQELKKLEEQFGYALVAYETIVPLNENQATNEINPL